MPNSVVIKPWGEEQLIAENKHYVIRMLKVWAGEAVSMQYHKELVETIYVVSGTAEYYLQKPGGIMTKKIIGPGDVLQHRPYEIHRECAIEDFQFIEISTPQINDIIRVEDDYGREKILIEGE